jgi:hypothetical protein
MWYEDETGHTLMRAEARREGQEPNRARLKASYKSNHPGSCPSAREMPQWHISSHPPLTFFSTCSSLATSANVPLHGLDHDLLLVDSFLLFLFHYILLPPVPLNDTFYNVLLHSAFYHSVLSLFLHDCSYMQYIEQFK